MPSAILYEVPGMNEETDRKVAFDEEGNVESSPSYSINFVFLLLSLRSEEEHLLEVHQTYPAP
jgi:hypothetical protein